MRTVTGEDINAVPTKSSPYASIAISVDDNWLAVPAKGRGGAELTWRSPPPGEPGGQVTMPRRCYLISGPCPPLLALGDVQQFVINLSSTMSSSPSFAVLAIRSHRGFFGLPVRHWSELSWLCAVAAGLGPRDYTTVFVSTHHCCSPQ